MLQLPLSLQCMLGRNRAIQLTESQTRTAAHAKIQTSTLQANRRLQPSLDMCKSRLLEPRSCCGTCILVFGDLMEPPVFCTQRRGYPGRSARVVSSTRRARVQEMTNCCASSHITYPHCRMVAFSILGRPAPCSRIHNRQDRHLTQPLHRPHCIQATHPLTLKAYLFDLETLSYSSSHGTLCSAPQLPLVVTQQHGVADVHSLHGTCIINDSRPSFQQAHDC
jgi:hypothetical protein